MPKDELDIFLISCTILSELRWGLDSYMLCEAMAHKPSSYKHLGLQIDRERFNGVLSKLWSHLWSDQHFPNAVACFSLIVGLVKRNLVWNYIYSGISYKSEFTRNFSHKGSSCQISERSNWVLNKPWSHLWSDQYCYTQSDWLCSPLRGDFLADYWCRTVIFTHMACFSTRANGGMRFDNGARLARTFKLHSKIWSTFKPVNCCIRPSLPPIVLRQSP